MAQNHGITIIGLGPGNANHLTIEAKEALQNADTVYVRTNQHPVIQDIEKNVDIKSFDYVYEKHDHFEDVYDEIITTVVEMGKTKTGIIYAVPGSPFVAESTSPGIMKKAKKLGIPCRIIEGISFIEPVCSALNIDPFDSMVMIDALQLSEYLVAPVLVDQQILVAQVYSRMVASEIKLVLSDCFSDTFPVKLVHNAGNEDQLVEDLKLYEIDRSEHIGLKTVLYLPANRDAYSFLGLQEIVARLRAPDGCPWDQKQTHSSLRSSLIEEAYEVIDAIDKRDPDQIAEELGDLLLQIFLHTQIAIEDGEFLLSDVTGSISRKLIRRHPHVFGNLQVDGEEEVLQNWEAIKQQERKKENNGDGMLDKIPVSMPALAQTQQIISRVLRLEGDPFETLKLNKDMNSMVELWKSLLFSQAHNAGIMLFLLVYSMNQMNLNAENLLRETLMHFRENFHRLETETDFLKKENSAEMITDFVDEFFQKKQDKD